ncbi:DUF4184 family protein [Actinomadura kijaniata]|uniref:DUF4184 family protein n=1 Tax=Actinomadura namibiensis TaxID=182080 RepID=A0A7W3LVJ5_ACTNM|nr:DUF4184 family protein [Actinomadura namibiensis]MBA8954992.1 hypothetical protein [Actinomadura namibiensis]
MPSTLSHPAAILPLAGGPLVPSALAVGTMAPDVPYFLGLSGLRGVTHEPLGVVTVDLGLGLAVSAAFHLVWKRPLLALAPDPVARRLAPDPVARRLAPVAGPLPRRALPWVPVSLLAGIVTHVLWDAFTHRRHSFAGALPWLVTVSFGGLAVLAWWLWRWFRATPPAGPVPDGLSGRAALAMLGLLAGGGLAGAALGAFLQPTNAGDPRTLHTTVAGAVVGAVSGPLVALTLYALLYSALARRVTSGRRGSGRASGP